MHQLTPANRLMPKGIQAIIYDVDDCLAPGSNSDIRDEWITFFASEFSLSQDEARRLNDEHFHTVGCSATGFARQFGRAEGFIEEVYARSATASGNRFTARHPVSPRLAELFGIIHARGVRQMVLTQGHPQHYSGILAHLGLAPYVPPHLRLDRLNMPHSKRGPTPYQHALYRLDLAANQTLLLEDTPANITPAANLGIHTVQIGDRPADVHATNVHFTYPDAETALEAFITTL